MIGVANLHPSTWKKPIYIASKKEVQYDSEGNEITTYEEPVLYNFNVQPISSSAEIAEFGEKASEMKKMVVPISYKDKFKEFDVAYIDITPDGEKIDGSNANYTLLPPRDGNAIITIYIKKLTGK